MGATDLLEIRRLRIGQTLGRRPEGTPLWGDRRAEARGGDRCDAGCNSGAEGRAPEGNAPGPRSGRRNDATARRRASSDPASRCLSPSDPQSWRSEDPGGNGSRGVRQRTTARRPNRSRMSAGTPWTAAALEAAQRAGSKPSRRRETSRTDRAGGGNPGKERTRQPMSSKGRRTPGGETSAVRPWSGPRKRALRGAQACGSRFGPSGPGQDARRKTSWPINTARRERRTDVAATSDGVELREAG